MRSQLTAVQHTDGENNNQPVANDNLEYIIVNEGHIYYFHVRWTVELLNVAPNRQFENRSKCFR